MYLYVQCTLTYSGTPRATYSTSSTGCTDTGSYFSRRDDEKAAEMMQRASIATRTPS